MERWGDIFERGSGGAREGEGWIAALLNPIDDDEVEEVVVYVREGRGM